MKEICIPVIPLVILVNFCYILIGILCYKMGERAERKGWNDLIKKGILPKPKGE
jgi:hypothetical protein